MNGATLREYATEAIRYWEPRRLIYNGVLAAIVIITYWLGLPGSKHSLGIDLVLWLFLLAVVANVLYCAAYLVDIFVQASAFRPQWQQFRWLLFALGVAFAGVLTRYFAMFVFAAAGAAQG